MGTDQMAYWTMERYYKHYKMLVDALPKAINEHETYCIDPNCSSTNWGGVDRLHYRDDNECPEFVPLSRINYYNRLSHAESWIRRYERNILVRMNAEDDAKINYYADKILEALNA